MNSCGGRGLLCFVFLAAIGSDYALAQTQRSGGDAAARVMQQLQQVTAEKSKLQQDNDALKKELETLKSKSSGPSAEQAKWQQRARELEVESNKLRVSSSSNEEALEKSRAQMQELIGKFRDTATVLKEVETERDTLKSAKTDQDRQLSTCVDKNAQLYLLGGEVLDRLEHQGVWSTLKTREPFTQLSRTRLENLVDDYRARVNELRLAGKATSTAAP